MTVHKIKIKDDVISYQLERTHNKRLYVRILPELGIKVSAPKSCTIPYIEDLLITKYDWLKKNLSKVNQKARRVKRTLANGSIVKYLGEDVIIQTVQSIKINLYLQDNTLLIHLPDSSHKFLELIIQYWYKIAARKIFIERYKECISRFPEIKNMPIIKIKNMTTRHGSYSTRTNAINLNSNLMKYPTKYIDFIIIHELCHTKHLDHSSNFYAYFDSKMPEHRQLDKELKLLEKKYSEFEFIKE